MPQYSGPVGPGPLDPYYTSNEYEKEQAALKAAEEQQVQQTAVMKGEVGPKTVNPLQGVGQALSTDYGPNIYGAIDSAAGALGLQTNLKQQNFWLNRNRPTIPTSLLQAVVLGRI